MNGTNRGIRLLPILIGVLVIGFMAVRGCQEGPFGRRQIVGLSPEQETRLGVQAFREVLSEADVVETGPVADAVRTVVRRLAEATREPAFLERVRQQYQKLGWEVRVVRSKQVNAFCLPGGKMVVYTAILPVCETDTGLAVVMGHEIAHALGHHGAERVAHSQMAQVGVLAAGASMGDLDPDQRNQLMMLLNAGAQFGILKYSRNHESEADHMGLLLMATAGYDPRESVRFWERMQRTTKGGGPPEFLSTHPSHETRIRDLNAWMDEAVPLYKASPRQSAAEPLPLSGRLLPEREEAYPSR